MVESQRIDTWGIHHNGVGIFHYEPCANLNDHTKQGDWNGVKAYDLFFFMDASNAGNNEREMRAAPRCRV